MIKGLLICHLSPRFAGSLTVLVALGLGEKVRSFVGFCANFLGTNFGTLLPSFYLESKPNAM